MTDLRAVLSRINASITQAQRADASAQSADAALEQVGGLIEELRSLTATAARPGSEDAASLQESRERIDQILRQFRTTTETALSGPVASPSTSSNSISQFASLDAQGLLDVATKRPAELKELLDQAAGDAGQWRKAIDDYRQGTLLPELRRLNDEIARAMLGGRGGAERPARDELTPERAAALLRTRPTLGG